MRASGCVVVAPWHAKLVVQQAIGRVSPFVVNPPARSTGQTGLCTTAAAKDAALIVAVLTHSPFVHRALRLVHSI